MSPFDLATSVHVRTRDSGATVHDVDVDPGWTIGDKPNGGYLLATMARAGLDAVAGVEGPDQPHVIAATATYVSPPALGPAQVHSEVLRRGRSMSQVRTRLVQDGRALVDATLTCGRLDPDDRPWWGGAAVPTMPDPSAARTTAGVSPEGIPLPIRQHVELRFDPATAGFATGDRSNTGELRLWFRFTDDRPADPLALLFAVDAAPPATFDLDGTVGWVPTLALSAYVRALPAPGSLVIRQRAGLVERGLVDEVCEVWDSRGRLVAQATQLAGIRTAT
jgi:Acyl-CoA thioesterase C-terminal domain/Acyl-CoA thioesterase N-terminal domain